jgi:pyruvate-ferredoxin/flavodoxin oxidoreductase
VTQGLPALKLDSPAPKIPLKQFLANEIRYRMLEKTDPTHAAAMQAEAQKFINDRYQLYDYLSKNQPATATPAPAPASPASNKESAT